MKKQHIWITFVIATTIVATAYSMVSIMDTIRQMTGWPKVVSYMTGSVPYCIGLSGYAGILQGIRGNLPEKIRKANMCLFIIVFIVFGIFLCIPTLVFGMHCQMIDSQVNLLQFWESVLDGTLQLSVLPTLLSLFVFLLTCVGYDILFTHYEIKRMWM